MESEQSQNFNERLSRWVASQGFWFQIRYSMAGSGSAGTAMFHLLRMLGRLLLLLVIVSVGIWIYLIKRTNTEGFATDLRDSLKVALTAEEVELGGHSRSLGELTINRLAAQGGPRTFFNSLEARNVRFRMGLLDGVAGSWDTGTVFVSRLDAELRAGADDEESAAEFAEALFRQSPNVSVNAIDCTDATLRWGYSERTRGSINNSRLTVQRLGDTLRLNFRGGTFSQNWLRKLEIVELVAVCDRGGFTLTTAEFRRGQGSVDLGGLKLAAGVQPQISGEAKIRRLALETALPAAARSFLEGTISGDFAVSGSTNSADGVAFEGKVTLDGRDTITLRERVHLLKALSVVDYVRNYKRIDFREGSFHLRTGAGGMKITDLSLSSDDLFSIRGQLAARVPTPEETREEMESSENADPSAIFNTNPTELEEFTPQVDDSDFSLRRAGMEAQRSDEGVDTTTSLFDRLGLGLEARRLEEQSADRLSRSLRYEGEFIISIPGDAFEETKNLANDYPVDPQTNRISMRVPVEGTIYQLTLKQAEEIYKRGER